MNKLELAESFFAAARELKARADHDMRVAEFLNCYGEALCEKNMGLLPEVPPPPQDDAR